MKKITLLLLFFIPLVAFSQKSGNQKFEINVSYGLSYVDFGNYSQGDVLDLSLPKFGSFYEINADYKLKHNRYIGIGYSRLQHSNYVDDGFLLANSHVGLILDHYKNIYQEDFFDIHFRKEFNNNMNLTTGVFYFIYNMNHFHIGGDGSNTYMLFSNDKARTDDFGLFASLEYYLKLRPWAYLGIKGKVYYSLNGLETISLLPTLRVKL
ncbi:MAG: hypothetical protein JXR65_10155 [Bacteroidales bacterium]|nr:hypothetical protein [Bacteroidales bacterium]